MVNRKFEHNGVKYTYVLIAKKLPWHPYSTAYIKGTDIKVKGLDRAELEEKLKKAIDAKLETEKELNTNG
jgi:hypothetical protein